MHISIISGYPHNPYNGVICNDVIAASGVFTTKELWKYSKGENKYEWNGGEYVIRILHSLINGHGPVLSPGYRLTFFLCSLHNGGRVPHAGKL